MIWIVLGACTESSPPGGTGEGFAVSGKAITSGDLTYGDLVITEVHARPNAVTDQWGEWFEIYNNSGDEVDLEGISVVDYDTPEFSIGSSVLVAAGDYAVISRRSPSSVNGGVVEDYSNGLMRLANVEDIIALQVGGVDIDRIRYTTATLGASRGLDPDAIDADLNDNEGNWCTATLTYGAGDLGTPGLVNNFCPGLTDADGDGYFAETGDCNDSSSSIHPGAYDPAGDGIDQNCNAKTMAEVVAGDLVITEVMADPTEVPDSRGEWVEIVNATTQEIDLYGLQLWTPGGGGGSGADLIVNTHTILEPSAFLVFIRNTDPMRNGGISGGYLASGLQLANGGDSVTLRYGTLEIDDMTYDSRVPSGATWSLSADAIDPEANDDITNWCESVLTYGDGDQGTPGGPNTDCGAIVVTPVSCGLVLTAPASGPGANGVNAPTVEWDAATSKWVMFFEYDPGTTPPGSCDRVYHIGRATSSDGLSWAIDATAALQPDTGDPTANCAYTQPGVVRTADGWEMFFSVWSTSTGSTKTASIGHATSPDGVTWTLEDPALFPGSKLGHASAVSRSDGLHLYLVDIPNIHHRHRDLSGVWSSSGSVIQPDAVPFSWQESRVIIPAPLCASRDGSETLGVFYGGRDRFGNTSLAFGTTSDGSTFDADQYILQDVDPGAWAHYDVSRFGISTSTTAQGLIFWYSLNDSSGKKAIGCYRTHSTVSSKLQRSCP